MARPKKNLAGPKLPKGVSEEFVDSIQSMTTDELKSQIVILQVQNQDNEEFKAGEGFTAAKAEFDYAKDRFDQVAGPVKETTVSCKNRTKIVVERLKERGGA
jgi:hypothetical protein